ncbi:MAG: alpha/beta fold hydrolase [Burkholderiales bacterium]
MPAFPHDGISTWYERKGSGRPLMLVAGLAADNAFWAPSLEALAARHDVVMPDNRGAGRTTPLDAPAGIRAMADDCIALADHLGFARFSVAGHSMGGMIAQDLAIRHPGRVDKLVLASTAPWASPRDNALFATWSDLFARIDRPLWFRNLFFWVLSPAFLGSAKAVDALVALAAGYPYQQTPPAIAHQVAAIAAFDARAELSALTARTLVMAGTRDLVFGIDAAAALAKSIPRATFAPIEGAAHSFPIESPQAFTERALEFLGEEA